MRGAKIFSGSSHPALADGICDRLGQSLGRAELRKFSNGETSVQLQTSIRDQDVFIVQSGSTKINDNVMELLIMISACKGGSSRFITAVMPYFPYSRQSKKKSHRGAITARMIANLLDVAGVDHVITVDLHASQMQGFFKCPVDNLVAEPLIAKWIKVNVANWREGVVVSKNPGGTKRVTSLADALKLSFGIVTTERRRTNRGGWQSMAGSLIYDTIARDPPSEVDGTLETDLPIEATGSLLETVPELVDPSHKSGTARTRALSNPHTRRLVNGTSETPSSPLHKSTRAESFVQSPPSSPRLMERPNEDDHQDEVVDESTAEEYADGRARDVIQGRLIHGHIVDDDFPSPTVSAVSTSNRKSNNDDDAVPDHMMSSFVSTTSSVHKQEPEHALGGTIDNDQSSEDEEEELKNPQLETMVTLVGNVKDRPVFIIDDMIDKGASWVAAAETVVKRGGATRVICLATHGLFSDNSLEELEECSCIDQIVVTNTFPIPPEKVARSRKLVVLGVETLLSEAIRRNHHGESISQLFMHYD